LLEGLRVAWAESEVGSNLLLHVSEVDKDGDHVTLLAVVTLLVVVVHNEVIATIHVSWEVVELSLVLLVGEQVVPRNAADGLLGQLPVVEALNNLSADKADSISLLVVLGLLDNPVSFTLTANTIEVDENLPNFFEAVKLRDADWIVKEAKYYQETYGIRFVRREVVERLDDWKLAKKPISGIAWYNLLANQKYEREFNYFPTDMDGRNDFIVDNDDQEGNDCEQSDMVAILVNLAYVK
jgi:hypothetical protein